VQEPYRYCDIFSGLYFNFIGPIPHRGETKLGSKWSGSEIPSSVAGGHITDLAFPSPELCGKSHFATPTPTHTPSPSSHHVAYSHFHCSIPCCGNKGKMKRDGESWKVLCISRHRSEDNIKMDVGCNNVDYSQRTPNGWQDLMTLSVM
jgi:hypothetical protein